MIRQVRSDGRHGPRSVAIRWSLFGRPASAVVAALQMLVPLRRATGSGGCVCGAVVVRRRGSSVLVGVL